MEKKFPNGNLLFCWWGLIVLKDYIKMLNNSLDGYNIEFFEDEKESIWMMANAYYKLISDFVERTTKKCVKS